jgi:hypothetical protein
MNKNNDYSGPERDARFQELDNLIAEQNRYMGSRRTNSAHLTEAEQAQQDMERRARLKREAEERVRARKKLLVPGVRRIHP